jgi:hypothetical protein
MAFFFSTLECLTSHHKKLVEVALSLEVIEADIPEGVPGDIVRTVKENCCTLKFKSHSFEQQ